MMLQVSIINQYRRMVIRFNNRINPRNINYLNFLLNDFVNNIMNNFIKYYKVILFKE